MITLVSRALSVFLVFYLYHVAFCVPSYPSITFVSRVPLIFFFIQSFPEYLLQFCFSLLSNNYISISCAFSFHCHLLITLVSRVVLISFSFILTFYF